MKHKTFNIRNVLRATQTVQSTHRHGVVESQAVEMGNAEERNILGQFMAMFTDLLQNKLANNNIPRYQYQIQARDKEVLVELLSITNSAVPEKDLKRWISDVVKTVCSSAFSSYSKGEMTFDQAKIYCSENILKNIVTLGQKYKISETEMEMMDKHIKNGVLNYLAAKYPLTESIAVNKKLEQVVRGVDVIESVQNNYFSNSSIVFERRQNRNYNDLIMRLINEVMSKVDQGSNYQQFQKLMSKIFQSVENEDWMNNVVLQQGQDLRYSNEKKEQYRAKVKEYTDYQIGRKVNENTLYFTQEQIQTGQFEIKNPQILRILIKWCEQLEQKYQKNYFKNFNESFKQQKGDQTHKVSSFGLKRLDYFAEQQFQQIERLMSNVFKNNYEMQAKILQRQLQLEGEEHIDSKEKASGKFAAKIVKNIHQYTITYLNQLIHGLLEMMSSIEYPLRSQGIFNSINLLSFKIGDLMRCKCSSKEKEILRIYQQINRISKESPEVLKIVRIKNRLRSETNDILMNVRFNNTILCEIQLAIHTKSTSFVDCSNHFHHYLYELQRSLFGPLTELCSIWNSLDRRTAIYEELIAQQQNLKNEKQPLCKESGVSHILQNYDRSFICSKCQLTICHNNYTRSHKKCVRCSYFVCARCILKKEASDFPKILLGEELSPLYVRTVTQESNWPTYGACIRISQKIYKVQIFKHLQYQGTDYLFGWANNKVYEICKVTSQKEKRSFRNSFIIFQLRRANIFDAISQQAVQHYFLVCQTKENFKKEKETIKLDGLRLTSGSCNELLSLGSASEKEKIKSIYLANNRISDLSFASKQFSSIEQLNILKNPLRSIEGIDTFKGLKKLSLDECNLNSLSPSLYNCVELTKLSLGRNELRKIDDKISNLQRLQCLDLQGNHLEQLSESFYQCKELRQLNLNHNRLSQLSEDLGKLKKLWALSVSQNQLKSLPESIGELQNLTILNLIQNKDLTSLPLSFTKLKKIEMIHINKTNISDIPINESGWPNLKEIDTRQTKITTMPKHLQKSTKIKRVTFTAIKQVFFENLPEVSNFDCEESNIVGCPKWMYSMKNVAFLNLSHNQIDDIKNVFLEYHNLSNLNLSNNKITAFPNLSHCNKLMGFEINNNFISSIPPEFVINFNDFYRMQARNNLLTHLPSTMANIPQLQSLDLENNKLTTLFPQQSGKIYFKRLSDINLNNNFLQEIPLSLCYFRLKSIRIDNNKIKRIRPQISQCTNLQNLSLNNNNIQEIPHEISALKNLRALCLKDNNITVIPRFMQTCVNLKTFLISDDKIRVIECIDWIIKNSSLNQFGDLGKVAADLAAKSKRIN